MKKIAKIVIVLLLLIVLVGCSSLEEGRGNVFKLNGVKLNKYVIVYSDEDSDYSKRAAEYISKKVSERTGVTLTVNEDDATPSKNEIVVGETNRDISKKLNTPTEGVNFATLYDNGSVALEGDKFVIAAAAYYFVETYITKNENTVPEETQINEPIIEDANNFILLIGDGMGVYQTKLFDTYKSTEGNAKAISDGEDIFYGYKFPYSGFARTNSLSGVTDSAAAGTALATGTKTKNGYIGKDKDLKDLKSLTELAFEKGMSTAVMSTESSYGATPSSFSAHANSRDNEIDIKLTQFNTQTKCGTVISGNLGDNKYTKNEIHLVENGINDALAALEKNSDKGFFIMYEEAYIDKNCHSNDMDKTFLAVVRFNQAIGMFMEYAFYNPDTFVLITADHETGGLETDGDGIFKYNSTSHTRAEVPVFAYGNGGELFDGKTIENVQIPKTIAKFMGVDAFGDITDEFPPLN